MAGCCDNFSMIDGGDEFKAFPGLKGEDGTTYYPHVSADGILSWTNDGGKTNPDPVDISGPPGRSVEMRGPVASVSDLPTTAPSDELWLVGSTSPYDGWFYNGTNWQNIGQISVGPQGSQGEQGEQGPQGVTFTPAISSSGWLSWSNDGGRANPPNVNLKGPAGTAAGFGTPTATVDQTTGTPSVTVTASGPDTAKVFAFAFSGIKGESGGGGGGTSNYNDLSNKPQIQGVTLSGNKTASDLGLALATEVLPAGGSTRDFLIKSSSTDYDAQWASVYSSSTPNMDGTGSAGIASTFSRSDHVHPKDTTKQDKIIASGLLKGDGSGGVSAAVAGTDYLTRETNYSPVKITNVSSYSIVADDAGKTILIDSRYSTVTLDSAVASVMPVGTEIALSPSQFFTDAYITLTLPTSTGRAAGAGGAFSTVKLKGGWNMYALKKMWSTGWYVTGPDLEVVT